MTLTLERDETETETELLVMLELGAILCGVPSSRVERIMSVDEAKVRPFLQAHSHQPAAAEGLLVNDGKDFAAWDLFRLLGLGPQPAAVWVLTALGGGQRIPVALRAGRCRAIERGSILNRSSALWSRGGAFGEFFVPRTNSQVRRFRCGAIVNLDELFAPEELQLSQRWVNGGSKW